MSLEKLYNLGPKSAQWLREIGIDSEQSLLERDPFDIYATLKKSNPSVSLNLLYALIGAKENRHWKEIKDARRAEILFRLDDLGLAPKQ